MIMKILQMYDEIRNNIQPDDVIFMDFELFFNDIDVGDYLRFSLDDEDIPLLMNMISRIKKIEHNSNIYVKTYTEEILDSKGCKFIYADQLWINMNNKPYDINTLFEDFNEISPSIVSRIIVNKEHIYYFTEDGSIGIIDSSINTSDVYHFMNNGKVLKMKSDHFIKKCVNAIDVYWD